MKKWLLKYRISAALDERSPMSPCRQHTAANKELRCFEKSLAVVESQLRNQRSVPPPPATLHASIMRAVRSAQNETVSSSRWSPRLGVGAICHFPFGLRTALLMAAAAALFMIAAVRFYSHQVPLRAPAPTLAAQPSLDAAGGALEITADFSRHIPSQMISPLQTELDRLSQDVARTKEALLATLP